MCVAVSLMPGATLTEEEIYRMGTTNGDGIGIAYLKGGQVHWYKTLKYKVGHIAYALEQHISSPRLVHFRLSTVGGTRPDLCHPFAINQAASCEAVGHADMVMIHNGHWHRYKELLELADKEGLLPDRGPWSDTRLIALMAADDLEWLKIITGKVATLDKDGQFTHIGDWEDLREGIKVSNKHWNHEIPVKKGGYSGFNKWPGWDKEWNSQTWEQWEAEKEEKAEKRKAEIKAALAAGGGGQKGDESGQEEQGASETGQAGIPGNTGSHGGQVGAANGVASGQGGGSGGRRSRLRGEHGPYLAPAPTDESRVRSYSAEPVVSKSTGRVYSVTPQGTVVEVTDKGNQADLRGSEAADYLAAQDDDSLRYRQYWQNAERRGAGGLGDGVSGFVEADPGDEDNIDRGGEA